MDRLPAHGPRIVPAPRHVVDGISREGLLSQVDVVQRRHWVTLQSRKVLAYLANPYAFAPGATGRLIQGACRALLPSRSQFRVAVSRPNSYIADAQPVVCLIWNLSVEDLEFFTARNVLHLQDGTTLFSFAWTATPSPFCVSVSGFPMPPSRLGRLEVTALIREWIRDDIEVSNFIRRYNDNPVPGAPPSLEDIVGAVRVSSFTTPAAFNQAADVITWNVYVPSPSAEPDLLRAWRDLITNVLLSAEGDFLLCTTTAKVCAMCLGTSHPTSRCPAPHAPGWNGPGIGNAPVHLVPSQSFGHRWIAFTGEALSLADDKDCYVPDGTHVDDTL